MRGVRLDSGAAYLVSNGGSNLDTYIDLVHITEPMGLARASFTPDSASGTAFGFAQMELWRPYATAGSGSAVAAWTGTDPAALSVQPGIALQPYSFSLPSPQSNLAMLQPQDVLVLHINQPSGISYNFPNGYLRLDLFTRR